MNILIWILMIGGGAAGMLSTAYLVLAMPVIFGWKVYRKLKYHIGLYEMGVLAPGAKEEVIRQERMAFSFVHQTTTEKVCEE